ncbi:MAG: Fic family protein [Coriobacteriia bacterium]
MTDSRLYVELSAMFAENQPVLELLKRVMAAHLTWDEFIQMRLPDEMSPAATWDLVRALKRTVGIEIPVPDIDGNEYWYLRTHEIADSIAQVQCLCRYDASLYRRLTATKNTPVLVWSRIEETMAAAHLDGLEVSADEYNEMLRTHRPPRTDNERLVANTLSALDHLDDLVGEPFSRELLLHLRDLVMKDVDPNGLVSTDCRLGLVSFDYADATVVEHAEQQLDYICNYANHLTGEIHDHAVFRALLLPDLFRFYRPLPNANSQVGRLAFRLYTQKAGIPVLGLLPISQVKLDWEDSRLGTSLVSFGSEAYTRERAIQGTDLTDYATLSLQLALVALLDLNWKLHELEREDDELRSLLQSDPEINHRQRSILGRALKTPDSEFRIAYHKTTHNVVYATARADLLELVDKGFLVMNKKGRAMVFTAREGLRSYIEHEYHRR